MSDGFLDFSIGENDDAIGKKTKRFSVEDGRSYRVTLCWFSVPKKDRDGKVVGWNDEAAFGSDGKLHPEAEIRFTGCERVYKQGVGYILYKGPAYAQFGTPKQACATILLEWPTTKDGDLDLASFNAGKGWSVKPWVFSADKYQILKKSHKRFPLTKHDMALECPPGGAQFQKITFTPEGDSLLLKLMSSPTKEAKDVVRRILADIRALSESITRDLARDLTVDQVREALGEKVEGPVSTKSHTSDNVDDLLSNVLG